MSVPQRVLQAPVRRLSPPARYQTRRPLPPVVRHPPRHRPPRHPPLPGRLPWGSRFAPTATTTCNRGSACCVNAITPLPSPPRHNHPKGTFLLCTKGTLRLGANTLCCALAASLPAVLSSRRLQPRCGWGSYPSDPIDPCASGIQSLRRSALAARPQSRPEQCPGRGRSGAGQRPRRRHSTGSHRKRCGDTAGNAAGPRRRLALALPAPDRPWTPTQDLLAFAPVGRSVTTAGGTGGWSWSPWTMPAAASRLF